LLPAIQGSSHSSRVITSPRPANVGTYLGKHCRLGTGDGVDRLSKLIKPFRGTGSSVLNQLFVATMRLNKLPGNFKILLIIGSELLVILWLFIMNQLGLQDLFR